MLELLNSAALASAETLVNRLLALDPDARARLEELSGTMLRIESTSPALCLNILVLENGLHFSARDDQGEADTLIRGPAPALLRLLGRGGVPASLHGSGIQITGNLEKAAKLQQALAGMKIDWEYQFGRLVGDIPTQLASDALGAGRDFFRNTRDSLAMDLDEYLHEEKRLFPDRREVALFNSLVDDLRLNTDRLEARVRKLTEKIDGAG